MQDRHDRPSSLILRTPRSPSWSAPFQLHSSPVSPIAAKPKEPRPKRSASAPNPRAGPTSPPTRTAKYAATWRCCTASTALSLKRAQSSSAPGATRSRRQWHRRDGVWTPVGRAGGRAAAPQHGRRAAGAAGGRSGSLDIPQLVEPSIIPIARPVRLIDLFSNRAPLDGNAFEYFQQTVRTNNATAVADAATKPTSVLTVAPHQDRCRVIAHLSEPCPIRLWYDHDEFVAWLTSEMVNGVLDGLEHQIVAGDGSGENMLGLLGTPGLTQVPFDTDAVTTLRSALTALQVKGEQPNGWARHPTDAEAIDLTRWGTAGDSCRVATRTTAAPDSAAPTTFFWTGLKRVITPSIPVGTAILGDFTRLKVYVRQDAHIDVDASGPLFTTNQFVARGEGRYGIGVLRPSAFARCDLTAGTTTTSKTAAAKK